MPGAVAEAVPGTLISMVTNTAGVQDITSGFDG